MAFPKFKIKYLIYTSDKSTDYTTKWANKGNPISLVPNTQDFSVPTCVYNINGPVYLGGIGSDKVITVSEPSTGSTTIKIRFKDNENLNFEKSLKVTTTTTTKYKTKDYNNYPDYEKPNNGIFITQCKLNSNQTKIHIEINTGWFNQHNPDDFIPTITIKQGLSKISGPDAESVVENYSFTIPRGSNKGGEIFTKWQSSNSYYYVGNSCSTNKSMTFTPIYTDGKFKLSVNLNGGTSKVTLKDTFTYGKPVDFSNDIYNKNIYRNGYTFDGFVIESGSGTFGNNYNLYIPNCIYNSDGTSDTTIKATWKPNTYKITYKLNYKKPIIGTYNTVDTLIKFFNGSSTWGVDKPYPFGEYKPDGSLEGNRWIWPLTASFSGDSLKNWLTGYEYTLNTSGGLNYNNAVDSGSWKKGIVTSGTSTIGQYGDLTLTLDVIPKSYEITYTESIPRLRLDDGNLIKILWNQKNVEIELKPESDLPTSYTILDDPKDLFNTRLLKEDKSIIANIETNKLKLGLDRGLYYNGNLKSKDNNDFSKLTENNKGINGPYQDYGKLYFTQEYKLSSFIFRFNYKYSSDNYTYIDSKLFYFMGELTNPFSNITLTPGASNNFTFDGWVDSVGVKVIDKDGNITNSGNKELKYFWGKKNSNNQYTYYLIAEKNEDPNNPRIIDLYPKWVRQSGVKVFDGKEWQYPTENGNTNIDNIKINDVDWNNIKEMKVYDGTDWKPVNLNHRPPDPDENIYEEI